MCYCDACNETNFLCETNGACFISRETINGTYQISQRYKVCFCDVTREKTSIMMKVSRTFSSFPGATTTTQAHILSIQLFARSFTKINIRWSVVQPICAMTKMCSRQRRQMIKFSNVRNVISSTSTESFFFPARIKCHCSFCGSSSQFTCETDGVCFLSWKQMNNELKYSQSCYDKKHFFPPDTPSFCELRNYDDYGRMCCDQDYCNSQGFRKEEVKFNAFALIFFIAFLLSVAFVVYQNWN